MRCIYAGVFLIILFFGCTKKETDSLFTKISPSKSGISFSNKIENSNDFNIFSYRNFYNGGGVAIGDFNNDNLPDIYLISNMESNKLFLNQGNFSFKDITETAGVGGLKAWSTGAVVADINSDGLLDIYVCNAGYLPKKSNQENELFINNGNLTFTEKASDFGLNHNGYTTHAAFFDYDLDGDLDVYILNNSFMPVNTLNYSNQRELDANNWPVKDFLKGGGDKLLKNNNGFYEEVTKEAGIYSSLIGFGLGVTVGDLNGDHMPDLYISNDFFERDYLYINQGDGTFNEEIEKRMGHISLASMGADIGDINNDGFPEIFVSEMLPDEEKRLKTEVLFENYGNYYLKLKRGFYHQFMHNTLQLNNGDESFSEIAWYSGVAASDWSWGALFFDVDNDGFRDIYVSNGTYQDVTNQDFINFFADEVVQKMALTGEKEEMEFVMRKMPSNKQYNRLFHNNHDLTFTETGVSLGFDAKSYSNGAAYGDMDNDGDLDLIVNNLNQEAFLFRNNSQKLNSNHFISVKLKGAKKNTFALGSKIIAYADQHIYNTYLMPSRGFQSSVDYKVVLGLGNTDNIDSLIVIWPDKKQSFLHRPKVDTTYEISYNSAQEKSFKNPYLKDFQNKYVKEINSDFKSNKEDDYIDFFQEGLVIKMLSKEGPIGASADVNGDGIDDLYIGGSSGQIGNLYIQNNGKFVIKNSICFAEDIYFEDTAVDFIDIDNDGDSDLYLGSGGNHQPQGSRLMQDRIYINDGKGNFTRSTGALPSNGNNTSVVLPFDIDEDGDLDLFVGSRSTPKNYGVSPSSYIYENNGEGKFKDATLYFAPFLRSLGMITDAIFVDLLENKSKELVIVGEWMNPVILKKVRSKYEIADSNLKDFSGWWYSIASDDIDNDGDMDLILGNRGENFYFKGTTDAPAKLWLSDFDNNGSIEKIITRQIDGRDMTIALKKELSEQVVSLRNQELTYAEFAEKSMQELFTKELLDKASVKQANYFKSCIAINEGEGNFTVSPLPKEVQLSSVNSILVKDLDNNGKRELILGGNDSGFMPQYSKLDASFGHILVNNGDGNYQKVKNKESGFFVKGDIRDFIQFKIGDEDYFLTLINNQSPKMYELTVIGNEK